MRNLIKKVLKESDEFDWVPELQKVVVTNRGAYYPTHLEAMVELNVTGAKEFVEEYGLNWWDDPEILEWKRENNVYDDADFLKFKFPNLISPENGDVCYMADIFVRQFKNKIFRLIRISDDGEFIINQDGFKPID